MRIPRCARNDSRRGDEDSSLTSLALLRAGTSFGMTASFQRAGLCLLVHASNDRTPKETLEHHAHLLLVARDLIAQRAEPNGRKRGVRAESVRDRRQRLLARS